MKETPFYFRLPGRMGRAYIVSAMMIGVIGIIVPFLMIPVPFLLWYGIKQVKIYKSEQNKILKQAIQNYMNNKIDESCNLLMKLNDKSTMQFKGIMGLICYKRKEYEKFIKYAKELPQRKVKTDLDIELKLADSYMQTKKYDKACSIYEGLLKFNKRSAFLLGAIEECKKHC